jgi:4-amino-4-deoxy-L-arabinose transferase-like glycosyltransferase
MPSSVPSLESPMHRPGLFDRNPRLVQVSMVVLFLMAGAIRLYRLDAPGLLIERDHRSAILARSFYFEHTDSVEQWRKEVAHTTAGNQRTLEPPVTEFLVSLLYRAADGEHLWFARLLTSSFWLIGGVCLYKIVERVVSTDAALLGTAYYLFVPLSITLSRSFAPDALTMMLFLISLYSVIRHYEEPSDLRLVIAAGISGLTILCRPLVLFALLGAIAALAISQGGWRRLLERRFLVFMVICLSPSILYYGYGFFVVGSLRAPAERHFRPDLLLHRVFWMNWLSLAGKAVGYAAVIGALLGALLQRKGLPRALVIGLGIGYAVFGLVFAMNIHTHDYYQAVLIPIVAISFGPLVTLIASRLVQASDRHYLWLVVLGASMLAVSFSFLEVRSRLGSQVFESVQTAKEIGEIVNHSSQVVWIARYYGQPLQYNGELTGAYWPRTITYYLYRRDEPELSIEQRLDALGFSPEYFVITNFDEFKNYHTDLEEYLAGTCPLVAENAEYLIYGACAQQ